MVDCLCDPNIRLLTLLGTGGIGKTRLAIEAVRQLTISDFEHGVFYVPLAPLTSADNIVTTIINVLGIVVGNEGALEDELINFLKQRRLLLVLDNFEHVLDGVGLVANILNDALGVKILTTSREMLNLSMEHLWHVSRLSYPEEDDPAEINQYDALNLFIERALQVQREFAPGDEQTKIIRICQLVDGLPLGIELAASWLKTLSTGEIIRRIDEGIDILSTRSRDIHPRHRSIRTVFDHSWDLLTIDEQAVFPCLSVFRGGFTLGAAEQVAAASLLTLSGLVEKSMIRRGTGGRYDIHELLRQYGEEKLEQLDTIRTNHLTYFAEFVANHVRDLQGKRQVEALDEIRMDFENILAVWQYGGQHKHLVPLNQMLEGIQIYFEIIRYPPISNEMYQWMLNQLQLFDDAQAHRLYQRIKILNFYVQFRQRKPLHTAQQLSSELEVCERHGDMWLVFLCHIMIQLAPHKHRHNPDTDLLLNIGSQLGNYYYGWALDQICYYYTIILNDKSNVTENFLNRYLEMMQSIHDINGTATAYSHLAQHARFWGNIDDAVQFYKMAIDGFKKIHHVQAIAVFSALTIFMRLKKGQFEDVIALIPHEFEQLNNFGFFGNHRYMSMVVAKAEILSGHLQRSREWINRIFTFPTDTRPRTLFHICEVQMMYAITIEDYNAVQQYMRQALQINLTVIAIRLKLDFLPLIAFLYHHDHQLEQAVELLGLAFTHPLATTGWMEKWGLLSKLLSELEHTLGSTTFQVIWKNSVQLDVARCFDDARQYIGLHSQYKTATQPLVEPLTNRELEVLQLLSKGYTNKHIAQDLIVSIGTVKKHVYNICQKLSVKNRLQAVNEARKLNLLSTKK